MVFFKLPFTFEYTIRKSLTVSNDKKNVVIVSGRWRNCLAPNQIHSLPT